MRSPTLTLVNPSPIGVVTGPLSATLFLRIESSSSSRQRLVEALERGHAGVVALPLDVEAGDLEDPHDRLGDFGADAVAGDQRDACDISDLLGRAFGRAAREAPRLFEQHVVGRERRGPIAVDVDLAEHVAVSMIGTTISDFVSMLHAR